MTKKHLGTQSFGYSVIYSTPNSHEITFLKNEN